MKDDRTDKQRPQRETVCFGQWSSELTKTTREAKLPPVSTLLTQHRILHDMTTVLGKSKEYDAVSDVVESGVH